MIDLSGLTASSTPTGDRGQQGVADRLQQAAHQIGAGLGECFAKQAGRVDNVWSGHRDGSIRECCERFTRRIMRWPRLRPTYTPETSSATALHHHRGLNSVPTDAADACKQAVQCGRDEAGVERYAPRRPGACTVDVITCRSPINDIAATADLNFVMRSGNVHRSPDVRLEVLSMERSRVRPTQCCRHHPVGARPRNRWLASSGTHQHGVLHDPPPLHHQQHVRGI
jgi:hypothetical protein